MPRASPTLAYRHLRPGLTDPHPVRAKETVLGADIAVVDETGQGEAQTSSVAGCESPAGGPTEPDRIVLVDSDRLVVDARQPSIRRE